MHKNTKIILFVLTASILVISTVIAMTDLNLNRVPTTLDSKKEYRSCMTELSLQKQRCYLGAKIKLEECRFEILQTVFSKNKTAAKDLRLACRNYYKKEINNCKEETAQNRETCRQLKIPQVLDPYLGASCLDNSECQEKETCACLLPKGCLEQGEGVCMSLCEGHCVPESFLSNMQKD
ncbi:MAG: hypothetical protein AABX73_02920 [Nanoarchaeota archaeon]